MNIRQKEILNQLRQQGSASVEALAEAHDVTVQTIRRDLAELESEGYANRVHGGAIPRSGVTHIEYEHRRTLYSDSKQRIGEAVAAAIPQGSSLFINIGTTTEAVARALLNHKEITVVTNNLNVANILAANSACEIIVAGGVLRRSDGGLTGNLTTQVIQQFKVDIAVIGTSALDKEGDLLDYDLQEVGVSRTLIQHARRVFLASDASKFERSAPVRITSLADIDMFFTDKPLPPGLASHCREWGTTVKVVS